MRFELSRICRRNAKAHCFCNPILIQGRNETRANLLLRWYNTLTNTAQSRWAIEICCRFYCRKVLFFRPLLCLPSANLNRDEFSERVFASCSNFWVTKINLFFSSRGRKLFKVQIKGRPPYNHLTFRIEIRLNVILLRNWLFAKTFPKSSVDLWTCNRKKQNVHFS